MKTFGVQAQIFEDRLQKKRESYGALAVSLDQYVGKEDNIEESLKVIESKGMFQHRPPESFNVTDRGISSQVNDLG